MSGEVLMTLGTIRFSVQDSAFQKLRRRLEIRIAKLERAGAQTARQVLGQDETIEIEGVVYPSEWKGGVTRVQSFRDLAKTQAPQLLTDGLGNVWGRYLLENVEENASLHTNYGVPLKQEFRIELGLYG
jgi:phage protein U